MHRTLLAVSVGAVALGATFAFPLAALGAATASTGQNAITGPCFVSGQFVSQGTTKSSTQYSPSSTVLIPKADTVNWFGNENGAKLGYLGPARRIDGAIQLALPLKFNVTIWHWSGTMSRRYSNSGQETYNLPSLLAGVKLQLSGYENENNNKTCDGSVYVKFAGSKFSNPIGWAGAGGSVILLGALVRSGFRKSAPAYDDINP